MASEVLRQVMLVRDSGRGHFEEVCWIDNGLATLRRRVRTEDGLVWTVAAVYGACHRSRLELVQGSQREVADVLDGH